MVNDDKELRLLIEHPGTEYYNELAQKIKNIIEFDLGYDADVMIGETNRSLSVYTEEGQKIFDTTTMPDAKAIRVYVNLAT